MSNTRENPYVGPHAFEIKDQKKFAGRDRDILAIQRLLIAERIVLLFSPSGAGKSSLLNAGLRPRMMDRKFRVYPVVRVNLPVPEDLVARGNVNRYVMSMLQSLEGARTTTSNEQLAGLTINDYLTPRLRPPSAPEGEELEAIEARSFFIFDQFEEILTVDPNDYEGKQEFFAQLGEALEEPRRWALFAVREDYVAALDPYLRFLPTRLANRYRLDLLDCESALEAIRKPAELMNVFYDNEASDHLINELRSVRTQLPDGDWDPEPHLGRYVEPVQLQVVCHRLWERIDEDDKITQEEVTQLGSVDESLAGFYEDKVKETAAAVSIPEKDIRTWFDTSLITPNNIRAQVMWEKDRSGGAENKLDNDAIAYLEKTHLIRAESRRGVKWLELAHDRLVKPVRENNRQWFEDPNNLSTLQRQAMLWAAEGEPPRLLLRDQELSEAEAWAAAGQTLSKTEQRFLDECLSQRKQVQDEEEKKKAEALAITNRRLRTRSRIAIFAAGIAILLAIFAGCQTVDARFQAGEAAKQKGTAVAAQATAQSNEELARTAANFAEEESARSLSLNLALNGSTMIDQNPPLAALLSLESLRVSGEKNLLIPPAAEQNIRDLLGVKHEYLLGGHANAVTHTIFSPDEQWLVTADKETGGEGPVRENSVRIWNMEAQDPSRVHAVQGRQLANILQANPDWAAVEISPDSQYIALGDKSGGIILYNLTKQEILTDVFIVPSGKEPDSPVEITTMAIGQQGGRDWLAVGSLDGTVVLIEFSEGSLRNIVTLPGSGIQRINTLAFSKDGRWLAGGSSDRQIRVWDMQRPESTPFSHPAQAGEIWGLAYSEEYLVAYGGSSTLFIYNAREPSNQPNMYTAASSLSEITVVAFDPLDPTRVIVGQADGSTWFLDLASLTSTPVFFASTGAVTHLVLTPDGRWLVSAGADRRVRLWSLNGSYETGVAEPSTVLRTFEDQINTLQLSPGGKWLAAGSADHSVALWDVRSGFEAVEPVKLAEADKSVYLPSFSADGQWLAAVEVESKNEEETSVLNVWNRQTIANGDRTLHLTVENVYSYAFSPNGNDLAVSIWENEVVSIGIYNLQDPGKEAQLVAQNLEDISFLSFSPGDGRWLAAYDPVGNEVLIWDTTDLSKNPVVRTLESSEPYSSFSFSPHGNWLAAVYLESNLETGDEIHLLKLADPSITLSYSSRDGGVYDFSFSPDERWFAVGTQPGEANGNVYLWDLSEPNPQPVSPPSEHTGYVNTLAFDTTSKWLATGDDAGVVRVWDVSGSMSSSTHAIPSHNDWVFDVSFSTDGDWFVSSAADGSLNLWIVDELLSDPNAGYYALKGHESFVTSLVFSPKQSRLVSSSFDGTIRLWDLSNPFASPIILRDSSQAGAAVTLSSDERLLLSDPSTGDARLWHLDINDLKTLACEYAGRNLSQEEWWQYVDKNIPQKTCAGLPD